MSIWRRVTLSDETDRVNAGVDDNLPLVTAQATVATAQSNLIESLYQYNLSKLALARAAGVLEQQYRVYLGTVAGWYSHLSYLFSV